MSFHPEQEPDRVPGAKLAWIAGVSTAITIASVVVAVALTHAEGEHVDLFAHAPAPAPRGTVERTLVEAKARGWDERRAQRAELDGFGWTDRDAGIAHVPIDRAMDLWIERQGEAR